MFAGSENIIADLIPNGINPVNPDYNELVLQRIRLRAEKRVLWLRNVWSALGAGTDNNGQFNNHTEVDGYLHDVDTPDAEKEWLHQNAVLQNTDLLLKQTESILFNENQSRLTLLCNIFGLSNIERDVLHTCFAFSIDNNLGRVFAYLHDHSARGYVTESLIARLFGYGRSLPLSQTSALRIWNLINEIPSANGEPARLECDTFIKNWLLGENVLDEALNEVAKVYSYCEPLMNWPVNKTADLITGFTDNHNKVRTFISGAQGSGRRTFASVVSQKLGMGLLAINCDRIADSRWQQTFMRIQRQAILANCAIAWYGATIYVRHWPLHIPNHPVQFVIGEVNEFVQPLEEFTDLRIEMPPIKLEERRLLWEKFVPASKLWPEDKFAQIIRRKHITINQILSIGRNKTITVNEAAATLCIDAQRRLGDLARQMGGTFIWHDLVTSAAIKKHLEDFTYEARERVEFWERAATQRLFPQGQGLIALFTGVSGTGKTMAAQVIAASLQLDLFRIDLSTVVSKYVGESSKNMERILSRAKDMDLILFFDEADSLFGKRTEVNDANDRFANTDTNYLLQAIEQYPGIAIMASNKKENMDTAFMRRLRYVIDFTKPDTAHRLQLWKQILSELTGGENLSVTEWDLSKLAESLDITGAQIKLSILSALFMARKEGIALGVQHLLKGVERELMKENRGLTRHIQQIFKV